MKMKRIIVLLMVPILFYGCRDTANKNLGDKYVLYIGDSYSTAILNSKNTVMIPPEVLDYAFDSTFIIAAQRPWDSVPKIKI